MVKVDLQKLEDALRKEHPGYAEGVHHELAVEMCDKLNECFEEPLNKYLTTGEKMDLEHGEFSLYKIMDLANSTYIDTIEMLNEYMIDPRMGRARIFRRRER